MRVITAILCVFGCLLAGCAASSAPSGGGGNDGRPGDDSPSLPAYDPSPWGLAVHLPLPDQVELIEEAGFKWARISLNWHLIQPEPDRWEWEASDEAVADLRAAGVSMMATLYGTPAWAGESGSPNSPPNDPQDWAAFVRAAVERYQDDIHHWGMWNEPNGGDGEFWSDTPEQFREWILKPGALAARQADPDCYVLGPGVTIHTDWMDWFRRSLGDGAAELVDIVTVHLYVIGDADDLFWLVDDHPGDLGDQWPLEVMLEELGLTDRPCWLEETGWATAGAHAVDEQEQARRIHDLFWRVVQSDVIEKVFLYELIDDPDSPEASTEFGIVAADGTLKPAYGEIQAFLQDPAPVGE